MSNTHEPRPNCYTCYRPSSSCMCDVITPIQTQTRFVLLMHPKEFKRTKNGTGHFTHLSLAQCELYVGIDFSRVPAIERIINDPNNHCYVLYPSDTAIDLNHQSIGISNKNIVIFLIDATWPCSRAMLRANPKLDALEKVSFTHDKRSAFGFKEQPNIAALSTMESTLCLLERLQSQGIEELSQSALDGFLRPFEKMVAYQLSQHH